MHLTTSKDSQDRLSSTSRHPANVADRSLDELLEQVPRIVCDGCGKEISRFEMFAIWAAADLVAHVQCLKLAGGRR